MNGKNDKNRNPNPTSTSLMKIEATFFGPLPPPSLLAKYNEVIPNGAERIMVMAERQSEHRERLESRVVDGNVANQTRGSYFAFTIALIAIVGGFYLILKGKDASGLAMVIGSLVALVSVFFYAKHEQKNERIEKSTALQTRRRR